MHKCQEAKKRGPRACARVRVHISRVITSRPCESACQSSRTASSSSSGSYSSSVTSALPTFLSTLVYSRHVSPTTGVPSRSLKVFCAAPHHAWSTSTTPGCLRWRMRCAILSDVCSSLSSPCASSIIRTLESSHSWPSTLLTLRMTVRLADHPPPGGLSDGIDVSDAGTRPAKWNATATQNLRKRRPVTVDQAAQHPQTTQQTHQTPANRHPQTLAAGAP